jgi:hypothetical protein
MDDKLKFRNLKPDEIEVRVAMVRQNGVSLLLYKNARCDQNILDETVGPLNWKRDHRSIDGKLFCNVSIYDEAKAQWISKEDVGSESNTEKEKGQASDSFKRACFNWGIGRELYTAPFIWIPSAKTSIDGRKCKDTFSVSKLQIKNKKIVGLEIINQKGLTVFTMGNTSTAEPITMIEADEDTSGVQVRKATPEQVRILKEFYKGELLEKLLKANKVTSIEAIPLTKASDLIFRLKQSGKVK